MSSFRCTLLHNGDPEDRLPGASEAALPPLFVRNCYKPPQIATASVAGICVVGGRPAQGVHCCDCRDSQHADHCLAAVPKPRGHRSDRLQDHRKCTPLAVALACTKLTTRAKQEKTRQKHFINLIPSENFTSQAVLDALGSVMQSTSRNLTPRPRSDSLNR